jgi:hypothetical protein
LSLNATRLSLALSCESQEGCFVDGRTPYQILVHRIEMVLRDILAPVVEGEPEGTLLQHGSLSGVATVDLAYRDRGGGLRNVAILVDGIRVAERISAASCAPPYNRPVPCPLSGRIGLALDTTSIADGEHRLEVELYDVAGNRTFVGPYRITVQNGPPPTAAAAIPAGRLSMRRATVRARPGSRSTLSGSLADLGGTPIPGASVGVSYRPKARDAKFVSAPSVMTDSHGRFSVAVPPGPSRVYRLRYAASESTVEVVVAAPVRLKATPSSTRNGRVVRFSGRVSGTAASGPLVELQAWADRKWSPFRTVRLVKGRFSARYRFTNTSSTTRYRFRTIVRSHPDLPYTAGRSSVVRVLVRP